jgi:hypothetical protein
MLSEMRTRQLHPDLIDYIRNLPPGTSERLVTEAPHEVAACRAALRCTETSAWFGFGFALAQSERSRRWR